MYSPRATLLVWLKKVKLFSHFADLNVQVKKQSCPGWIGEIQATKDEQSSLNGIDRPSILSGYMSHAIQEGKVQMSKWKTWPLEFSI